MRGWADGVEGRELSLVVSNSGAWAVEPGGGKFEIGLTPGGVNPAPTTGIVELWVLIST